MRVYLRCQVAADASSPPDPAMSAQGFVPPAVTDRDPDS